MITASVLCCCFYFISINWPQRWILIFKYIWQPAGVAVCTCLRAAFQRLIAVSSSLMVRDHSVVFTDHCSFMTHHTLIQSRKKFICSNVLIPGRFNMKLMDSIWRNIFASLRPAYCCNLWFSFIYSPRSQWICLWPSTMDDTDRLFIGNFIFVLLKKIYSKSSLLWALAYMTLTGNSRILMEMCIN